MKLIEAMKLKKELQTKAEDLRSKIGQNCAHLSIETPLYKNPQEQVDGWLQSHQDIVKQIRKLGIAIQKTNLATKVTLSLGGEPVELSIAEWVLRRRELAAMESAAWGALSDRNLRDGKLAVPQNGTTAPVDVRVVRYYDPVERDRKVDLFKHEPNQIDSKLEVVNAITEIVEEVAA